jgi:hypothetical protein
VRAIPVALPPLFARRSCHLLRNRGGAAPVEADMKIVTATVMVALAVLAGGCLGSGSAGSSAASRGSGPSLGPATVVTLSWPVGEPTRTSGSAGGNCPALASCRDVHTDNLWWTLRRRTLRCPSAAAVGSDCAALHTLVRALRHGRGGYCPCPLQLGPADRITGRYNGRPLHLTVSSCAVCGLPRAVQRAFATLFPPVAS